MTTASALIVAAGSSKGSGLTPLLLLVALFAFAYLILIRPQRARARALQKTQATLGPGAEIMTTAGLYATVVEVGDDTVTLETSPGVHQRYARAAVARVISTPETPDDADDAADVDTDGEAPDGATTVER